MLGSLWAGSLGGNGCWLPSFLLSLINTAERRKRLSDDLVHVVISVGRQPPNEGHIVGRIGKRLLLLEQLLVLGARDRIIRISLGRGIFVGDRRHRSLLPGQMLVLADPGERHVL